MTTDQALFVRAEMTPNPQTLRFVTNQTLTEQPTEFKKAADAVTAPLARKLFGFPWTDSVYIGRDFVAVTKQDWVDWETLAEPLAGLIQEHLESGEVVMQPRSTATTTSTESPDSADVQKIKAILDTEIRPAVALDGGDIVFHKFEDGVVHLFMQGACAGCPSSTMTLKQGIEARLMNEIPSIREVVSV
jgi:Fe-S cluster biogenesis protein NfuA